MGKERKKPMSRYVDIDQIIADIYKKWGCDPAYYVGVSGADAHEAKLDADLIELLRSKPSIDIVRCGECEFYCRGECVHPRWLIGGVEPGDHCSWGDRRKHNE